MQNADKITAVWLTADRTQAVFEALERVGFAVRAVGGAPRNTLAGHSVKDVDLATTAKPAEIIAAADRAKLKSIPTGIDHGTVTVISEGVPYEVTTLREDIETDGRHATVAFTQDWASDAARRDFTVNAIYVDREGTIFDPYDGRVDLANKVVRFIGDAKARIEEDYLRILRFFRFSGAFAEGRVNEAGLSACHELREGLATLSGERLGSEVLGILRTEHAADVVSVMAQNRIFEAFLTSPIRADQLAHLMKLEDAHGLAVSEVRRLASIAVHDREHVEPLSERLRLSNAQRKTLTALAQNRAALVQDASEHEVRGAIYRLSQDLFRDVELLAWARSGDDPMCAWRFQRLELSESWEPPCLPVAGGDVVAKGLKPGPNVGVVLRAFEDWWIENDFPADEAIWSVEFDRQIKAHLAQ